MKTQAYLVSRPPRAVGEGTPHIRDFDITNEEGLRSAKDLFFFEELGRLASRIIQARVLAPRMHSVFDRLHSAMYEAQHDADSSDVITLPASQNLEQPVDLSHLLGGREGGPALPNNGLAPNVRRKRGG